MMSGAAAVRRARASNRVMSIVMRSMWCVMVALAAGPISARADVFFEISRVGEAPDGLVTQATIGEVSNFDVWVWATGADASLKSLQFTLAGSPTNPNNEWTISTLGVIDPAGALGSGFVKLNGTLGAGVISNAGLVALPPNLLNLGSSPAVAFNLYGSFTAQNLAVAGLLSGTGKAVNASNANAVVHFIGVQQTPAPGAIAVLVLAGCVATRRRRE